jgi:ubiquinone/menaquinone biosynthesis C-methylase UbiE
MNIGSSCLFTLLLCSTTSIAGGDEVDEVNSSVTSKIIFTNIETKKDNDFPADQWDAKLYCENSGMQKNWALEALDLVDLSPHESNKVLDVGSGDGGITATIAKKYPRSSIVGLDLSPNMVKYANTEFGTDGLVFVVGDAQKLPFNEQFNLITSFSTLHRLRSPHLALHGIYAALKPMGLFLATFPVNGSYAMTEAIAAVDSLPEWKEFFDIIDRKDYQLSDELCRGWLTEAGFNIIQLRVIWRDEIFETRAKFRDLLRATFSHRSKLPADKEMPFFEEVVDAYLKRVPLDDQGRVHFYYNHIRILAIKPPRAKI